MSIRKEWELSDPTTAIGRRFNDVRRRIHFVREEFDRLKDENPEIQGIFYAAYSTIADAEDEFNDYEKDAMEFDNLAKKFQLGEITDISDLAKNMNELSEKILPTFPKIMMLEERIGEYSEYLPMVLNLHIQQLKDKNLGRSLAILEKIGVESMKILKLDVHPIIFGGQSYTSMYLRDKVTYKDQALISCPISCLSDPLGWIPIGHEVGHILFVKHKLDYNKMLHELLKKLGYLFDEKIIVCAMNWFEEIFADMTAIEIFGPGAVYDLNSVFALERIFHVVGPMIRGIEMIEEVKAGIEVDLTKKAPSLISDEDSHPPSLLRVYLMALYLKKRAKNYNLVSQFESAYLGARDSIPKPWNIPEFQVGIVDLVSSIMDERKVVFDSKLVNNAISIVKEKGDIEKCQIIHIISALSCCYSLQNTDFLKDIGDIPEWIFESLMSMI